MENKSLHSKKIHNYMLHRLKVIFWNKLGVNPSPFHVSTRLRLTSAVVARGGYVPLVALPSAVLLRRNESGGT